MYITEDIALVTLSPAPGDICFVSTVFEALAGANINVDMISQSPPQGSDTALSFSISDADLPACLTVISTLREAFPSLKSMVSNGNVKVLVSAEYMRTAPGVASKVFQALAEIRSDIRLITTAETEISMLIAKSELEKVKQALEKLGF